MPGISRNRQEFPGIRQEFPGNSRNRKFQEKYISFQIIPYFYWENFFPWNSCEIPVLLACNFMFLEIP